MQKATVTGLVVAALLIGGGGHALAQSVDSDQTILQRQRELLIEKRREQQRTRTLLEINPQTGTTEPSPSASTEAAVLSATPAPSTKMPAPASQSRQEVATAPVPAELAPEDQLFRPIKFAYDSAYLDDAARETLSGLCPTLQTDLNMNPGSSYFVIGHTDSAGSDDYNLTLSQRRAEATKDFLVRSCGIATAQIEAVGMGEQRLLANYDARASNQRRVEIQVRLEDSGS